MLQAFGTCPAVAQPGDRTRLTVNGRHCSSGPRVWRTPGGGLVLDWSDLFEVPSVGTYRVVRSCPPLFRPHLRKG
jgi:hypothetical protein